MALRIVLSPVTTVRSEATNSNGALPPRNPDPSPRLSFSKPSWVVRTESNVRKEVRKTPDPPCDICTGSGRIDCHFCQGKVLIQKKMVLLISDVVEDKLC
ncbi:uncharacterized protein LOC112181284 isoform X3 [Rosa chinensis]|uniref:uncharacterized protein LOC112181284 isoform X3 n=1 Tax=Rosa chinensis TaxID=74649 RepID=UPI000D08785E|nr:uncharacterized protein LOC112181284 isoform X3 [Rosa chinensis]